MGLEIHRSHFRKKSLKTTKPDTQSPSSSYSPTPPSTPSQSRPTTLKERPAQPPQPPSQAEPEQQSPTLILPPWRLIPPGKNHYATLNIPITASPSEIQQAYHTALAAVPNNENNFDSESLHLQNVLDEAMHILTHPYKKTIFDRSYTDELLNYHDWMQLQQVKAGDVEDNDLHRSNADSASNAGDDFMSQASDAEKVELWKASLMDGLNGEAAEEVFGRVGWERMKERQWHFRLTEDFGGAVEDCLLWAPNLFAGGVSGYEGWIG